MSCEVKEQKLDTCNHLVSRKSGDVFVSYFAHACECPHCLAQKIFELEKQIKSLKKAGTAAKYAISSVLAVRVGITDEALHDVLTALEDALTA